METNPDNRWIEECLAALEPQWQPDVARAREMLESRLAIRWHSSAWIAVAAAAAVCIAVLATPNTRAIAQQLFDRFVLNRVDIVRVDLSRLPLKTRIMTNGVEDSVKDLDEAEQRAGFRPYLPPPEVLPAQPELKVSSSIHVEQIVRTGDLEAALKNVGASDVQVPSEWDGVTLRTEIGPIVTADYPENVRIEQWLPFDFSVPSGFPLERFAEVAFRSIGVSSWQARALGQRLAAHPAWLFDIPPDRLANIRDVRLRTGPALLIEDFDDKGVFERATIIRTTGQRIFGVTSSTTETCLRIADALP